MKIIKYQKKNGDTLYMVKGFIGIDARTGKKQFLTKRGFKTEKEAKSFLANTLVSIEKNGIVTVKKYTFKEITDIWLDSYKNTVRQATLNQYNALLNKHILPIFANTDIKKITPILLQETINNLSENINHTSVICGILSHVFQHALRLNVIPYDPMKKIIKPKQHTYRVDEKIELYTKDELIQLLEYAKTLDTMGYLSIHLLAYTGMRKGELMALRWSDIDFNEKSISIKKTVVKTPKGYSVNPTKTKDGTRIIAIDEMTISLLNMWQIEQRKLLFKLGHGRLKDNLIICNVHKNSFVSSVYINYKLKYLCEKYNFKYLKPHALRHTHCSLMLASGVPIQDVQKRLGHSNIEITLKIYTHISRQQQQKAVQSFSKFLTV